MRHNEDKNINYTTAKMVTTQLKSLKKIKKGGQEIPHYNYIIIDEITSFIKHFTSSTMKKTTRLYINYSNFKRIIQ